jgi:hypothetical protein
MALRALYPNTMKWDTETLAAMTALFEEYGNVIQLSHIGFPDNWAVMMRK